MIDFTVFMNKTELKEIVLQQQKTKQSESLTIERDILTKIESYIKNPFVIVISGIRRTGKSTLLHQIKEKYT